MSSTAIVHTKLRRPGQRTTRRWFFTHRQAAKTPKRSRVLFESLEKRVLLSADPMLLLDPALEAEDTSVDDTAIVVEAEESTIAVIIEEATAESGDGIDALVLDESATTIQDVGGFEGGFIDPPIEDLEKDEILAAVQGLSDLVDSLETSSDLAEDIAVIGQSLDDLIDISDVIDQEVISVIDTYFTVNAGDFGGVPLANTDDLVAALQASLDASLGAGSSVSGGATGGGDLGFVVQFETSVSQFLPFVSLDLDELGGLAGAGAQALLGGASNLTANGVNNVQVDATASYDLQFGVDLSGATPTAFILDDTNIGINLTVIGDDLDFTAALGPLGVTVIDGSVTLDGDGNPLTDDAATYSFDLIDDAGDGLYLVSELDTSIVAEQTDGVLNVDLPLFYPTASNPLGGTAAGGANVLSVDVADLGALFDDAAGSVAISTPDLVPQIALNDLLNDPNVVRAGIEGFFTQLADSIAPSALAVRIPIIGDGLSAIDELFDDLRDAAINAFNAGFDDSGGPLDPVQAVSRIQDALFAAFSSGGLALLDDLNEDGVVDADDIQIVGDGDHVQFDVSLHQDLLTLSADLDFDIGLPSLEAFFNFESSGSATLEAGYDMDFRFGVDLTDGFYVDTSEDDEISISVEARIPNFSATVNLLLLGGTLADNTTNPSFFDGTFAIDLTDFNVFTDPRDVFGDPPASSDGRLTGAEIAAVDLENHLEGKLSGEVEVHLDMDLFLPSVDLSFLGIDDFDLTFPGISAEFVFEWEFLETSTASSTNAVEFGEIPVIAINNISVSFTELWAEFLGPILQVSQFVLAPLQPIIDILTFPLPIFSDFAGESTTLLDLAGIAGTLAGSVFGVPQIGQIVDLVGLVVSVADALNSADPNAPEIIINIGSFDFTRDLRIIENLNDPNELINVANAISGGALQDLPVSIEIQNNTNQLFNFPLFSNPTGSFINLILGRPVDLLIFQPEDLEVGDLVFRAGIPIPILPPFLTGFLGGEIGLETNFAFGYDTFGLEQFSSSGNPVDLLDGFFISDNDNPRRDRRARGRRAGASVDRVLRGGPHAGPRPFGGVDQRRYLRGSQLRPGRPQQRRQGPLRRAGDPVCPRARVRVRNLGRGGCPTFGERLGGAPNKPPVLHHHHNGL